MPSTNITEIDTAAASLQTRTDSAGAGVTDVDGEDLRLYAESLQAGVLNADDFEVVPGTGMTVDVGSGVANQDVAVVDGDTGGQGKYLVRLADTNPFSLSLSASDPTNDRIDEVYLVVYDHAYDASSRTLPRFAIREGDPAGSPSAPGVDAAWKASLLLASLLVQNGVTTLAAPDVTDERSLILTSVGVGVIVEDAFLPDGTTSAKGIVQLVDSAASSSTVLAPTAAAVKVAKDAADAAAATAGHSHPYAATAHVHSGADITTGTVHTDRIANATTASRGDIQLIDSVSSVSIVLAPTAAAVKSAYDLASSADGTADSALQAHTGTGSDITVSTSAPSGGQNGDIWLEV
jgi:hypothetical protein